MKQILSLLLTALSIGAMGQNMPFITKVYDFLPAPGQFVNSLPEYNTGEPKDSLIARAERAICGYVKINNDTIETPGGDMIVVSDTTVVVQPSMISLGSYGGYVIFGFDHPVVNVKGEYDMQIFGNAFQAAQSTAAGGSSEPGIVMVSRDVNGNGLPDDPWYELAGSEYNNPRYQKDFTITYYKPDPNHTPVPQKPSFADMEYIRWTCNSVDSLQEGYVYKNTFHSQSYWPEWIEEETLTFTGNKLPCNAVDESGKGTYFVQHFYDWGYVDNRPDMHYGYGVDAKDAELNKGFKIDWAVDADGNHVDLKKIDFVKVYNGVLQYCGWLGETSTEVAGGIDLHPDAVAQPTTGDVNGDDVANSADVTALYNLLLNGDSTYSSTSDVNDDGTITAADVTSIYNIMLNVQ